MRVPASIALVLCLIAIIAPAATITVTSTSGGTNDGTGCTLRDAIQAVNTAMPVGQCPAGSSGSVVNTIDIQASGIGFSVADAHSTNAVLPAVVAGRFLNIFGNPQVHTELAVLSTCNTNTFPPVFSHRILEVNAVASVYIADVNFTQGCPGAAGGAILNDGTLSLVRARLFNNTNAYPNLMLTTSYFNGGAVYSGLDARLSITDTTFDSNSGNGALYVDADPSSGYAIVDRTTFVGNQGGAINNAGFVAVTNTTFFDNLGPLVASGGMFPTSSYPGGAIANSGSLSLSFASLRNNSIGVGLLSYSSELELGGSALIKSTLFGTPAGMNTSNCNVLSGAPVSWYGVSISNDATCVGGANLVNTDTGLDVSLADNGGSTQTLKLRAGSPAFGIDANCLDTSGAPVTVDQRGFTRPQAGCDAGAYEDTIFGNGFE